MGMFLFLFVFSGVVLMFRFLIKLCNGFISLSQIKKDSFRVFSNCLNILVLSRYSKVLSAGGRLGNTILEMILEMISERKSDGGRSFIGGVSN